MMQKILPQGWKEVELGEIFDFQKKSRIKAGEGSKKGQYKFFTSSDKQTKFINEYSQDGEYLIFATGGHAGIHYCNEKFATSTDCFIVKVDNQVLAKYVYYYLFSKIQLLEEGFKGAGLKHISKVYIQDIKLFYPEDKEAQKAIVSLLEKAEKAKEWRKKADDLTNGFLNSIFIEMFGDPLSNNKNYPTEKVEKLCNLVRGSSPRPKGDPRYYGGSIPRLMIKDLTRDGRIVTPKIDSLTEEGAKLSRFVKKNTVVLAVSGDVGATAILNVDACVHDGFVAFNELDKNKVNTNYFEFLLRLIKVSHAKRKVGAIFQNLTTTQIKEIDIPLPPKKEQERFSKIITSYNYLK